MPTIKLFPSSRGQHSESPPTAGAVVVPHELTENILLYVDDLQAVASVCRKAHQIVHDKTFLARHYKQRGMLPPPRKVTDATAPKMYRALPLAMVGQRLLESIYAAQPGDSVTVAGIERKFYAHQMQRLALNILSVPSLRVFWPISSDYLKAALGMSAKQTSREELLIASLPNLSKVGRNGAGPEKEFVLHAVLRGLAPSVREPRVQQVLLAAFPIVSNQIAFQIAASLAHVIDIPSVLDAVMQNLGKSDFAQYRSICVLERSANSPAVHAALSTGIRSTSTVMRLGCIKAAGRICRTVANKPLLEELAAATQDADDRIRHEAWEALDVASRKGIAEGLQGVYILLLERAESVFKRDDDSFAIKQIVPMLGRMLGYADARDALLACAARAFAATQVVGRTSSAEDAPVIYEADSYDDFDLVEEEEWVICCSVIKTLKGVADDPNVLAFMLGCLANHAPDGVRAEAALALGPQIQRNDVRSALLEVVNQSAGRACTATVGILSDWTHLPDVRAALLRQLDAHNEGPLLCAVIKSLGGISDDAEVQTKLITLAASGDGKVQQIAIRALKRGTETQAVIDVLCHHAQSGSALDSRLAALNVLAEVEPSPLIKAQLLAALHDTTAPDGVCEAAAMALIASIDDAAVRHELANVVGRMKSFFYTPKVLAALTPYVHEDAVLKPMLEAATVGSDETRAAIFEALTGAADSPAVQEALIGGLRSNSAPVVHRAAIRALTQRSHGDRVFEELLWSCADCIWDASLTDEALRGIGYLLCTLPSMARI